MELNIFQQFERDDVLCSQAFFTAHPEFISSDILEVIHALRSQEFAQLEVLWKHYAYVHFHDRRLYAECMGTINCQLQLYADCLRRGRGRGAGRPLRRVQHHYWLSLALAQAAWRSLLLLNVCQRIMELDHARISVYVYCPPVHFIHRIDDPRGLDYVGA